MTSHPTGARSPPTRRLRSRPNVGRLVTLALPHPGAIGPKLFAYEQLKRSFYVFVFQTPVAEMAVAPDDLAFIDGLWRDRSPDFDATDNIAAAKDALRHPSTSTPPSATTGLARHDRAFDQVLG
jgi:hypothetical protein